MRDAALVDEVDRLVGQVAVLDVALGERGGGGERLIGDLAAVVRLVAVAEAAEDLHNLVDGGLFDADLLEAALEGRVALEYLRYSSASSRRSSAALRGRAPA